jgi:multidrug efflux pump
MIVYAVIAALMIVLFLRMPGGFLPEEDQGTALVQFTLPPGAVATRTAAVGRQIEHHMLVDEKANVQTMFVITGFNFGGVGQNLGIAFIKLKDWDQRKGAANRAPAIVGRAMAVFSSIRDAQVFAFVPPAVQELGNANGFDLQLTDTGGVGHDRLIAARNQLLGMAMQDRSLVAVRPNGQEDTPQLDVRIDAGRAGALGLQQADINDTLGVAFGSSYINQFTDRGRVKRVYMQGDAPFRMTPGDLDAWRVRTATGTMAPVSSFADVSWSYGPTRLERYNGAPSIEILGQGAPGVSSGQAMAAIERLVAKLPPGIGHEWTGLSYQERLAGSQGLMLYALALVVVFLCLAALYESWSVPLGVLMVVPLGVVGAVLLSTMRGFDDDIYFQVGLLTTIGLACKNAILIIEYAIAAEGQGKSPVDAAIQGARLRLRPILMTSLAFVAGCLPLMLANGAGSGSQNAIGTAVVGGMIAATMLAIFFVPIFFVLVRTLFRRKTADVPSAAPEPEAA